MVFGVHARHAPSEGGIEGEMVRDRPAPYELLTISRLSFLMSKYHRPLVPGATVFFTVTLADRGSDLLVREIGLLREAVRRTLEQRPFLVDAIVVLPDHMRAVWTLPPDDTDYATRWRQIKSRFRGVCQRGNCAKVILRDPSVAFGSGDSGNIISGMPRIIGRLSLIAGTTRSSTGWSSGRAIGPIRRSTGIFAMASPDRNGCRVCACTHHFWGIAGGWCVQARTLRLAGSITSGTMRISGRLSGIATPIR
jgi:REP element-mobilizing transposase RayT